MLAQVGRPDCAAHMRLRCHCAGREAFSSRTTSMYPTSPETTLRPRKEEIWALRKHAFIDKGNSICSELFFATLASQNRRFASPYHSIRASSTGCCYQRRWYPHVIGLLTEFREIRSPPESSLPLIWRKSMKESPLVSMLTEILISMLEAALICMLKEALIVLQKEGLIAILKEACTPSPKVISNL